MRTTSSDRIAGTWAAVCSTTASIRPRRHSAVTARISWLWETATNIRSPGFEVNDLSFMGRADYIWNSANIVRQWTVPGAWYRSLFADIGSQTQHNFSGDRTDLQGQMSLNGQLRNYWGFNTYYIYHPTVMDDDLTRGGPVVKRNGYQDLAVGLSTDPRKWFVLQVFGEGNVGINEPAQQVNTQLTALFKPVSNVSFGVKRTAAFGEAASIQRSSVLLPCSCGTACNTTPRSPDRMCRSSSALGTSSRASTRTRCRWTHD